MQKKRYFRMVGGLDLEQAFATAKVHEKAKCLAMPTPSTPTPYMQTRNINARVAGKQRICLSRACVECGEVNAGYGCIGEDGFRAGDLPPPPIIYYMLRINMCVHLINSLYISVQVPNGAPLAIRRAATEGKTLCSEGAPTKGKSTTHVADWTAVLQ